MNILHTISGIWRHTGGPAEVVPLLCEHLRSMGNRVSIATLDGDMSDAALAAERAGVVLYRVLPLYRGRPRYSLAMRREMGRLVAEADVVHGNGLWEYTNWCTASEARRQRRPYLISFQGAMMNPGRNWRWRHHVAWRLLDGRHVRGANCLHACTEEELCCIRDKGLRNPVAVIPNGVETWEPLPQDVVEGFFPRFHERTTVLFLSRVHPSKGVYDLVEAWAQLPCRQSDWQLMIAGPGRPEHVETLKRRMIASRRNENMVYLGPLFGDKRAAAYQACDVFVLPSYSENFGLVVGEALAAGKPVIATHPVPWGSLQDVHCGWWVPMGVASLRAALLAAMETPEEVRSAMGKRGKALIQGKYLWPKVARQMLKTYEWVRCGGATPEWVDCV